MGLFGFFNGMSRADKEMERRREQLYDKFAHDEWASLAPEQKLDALQALENDFAYRQGRPAKRVRPGRLDDNTYGGWSEADDCITINENLIYHSNLTGASNDPAQADVNMQLFDTIAHEGYHAYQSYALKHPEIHADKAQLNEWLLNKGRYWNPDEGERYLIQPVERDAWRYGHEATLRAFQGIEARHGAEPEAAWEQYESANMNSSYEHAIRAAVEEEHRSDVLRDMRRDMEKGCADQKITADFDAPIRDLDLVPPPSWAPPSPVTEGAARDAIHIIPADSIDMTFARGMDEHFWDPRGDATRERFMDAASHIPEVQTALSQGVPLNELINDPKLGGCASIYFDPKNVIGVHRNEHGGYEYGDNGRHRIMAAAEMGYYIPVRVVEDRYRGPERTEGSDQSSERRGRAGVKPLVAESSQQLRGEPAVQADASAEARGQNVGSDDVHGSSVNQNDGNIPTSARSAKYGSRAVHTYERQLDDDRHVPAPVDGQSHTAEHADSRAAENEARSAVEREHDREMSDRDESRNDVAGDRVDSEQEERRGNRTEDPERERPQAAEQTETSENKVAAETHRAAGHEEPNEQKSSERIRLVDRTGQDETPEIDGESQTGERDHDRTDEPGQNTAERFDKSNDESNAASNVRTQTIEQDDSPTVEHETDRQQAYGDDGVAPEAEDRSQTTEHVTQAEQTLDGAAEEEAAAQTVDDGETVTEGMTDDHDQTVEASQNEIVEPDGLGANDHTVNDSLDQDEAHGQDAALDEDAERGENIFQDEQLARTADLDRDENQSQGEVRSQDENLSMDEDLSRDDDLSMDQMTGQSSAYDQSQDETQNESQSESQDEDLSMDDLSAEPGQVEQDEQAVQTEQASQNEQVQDEDPSMGRMTGRSVDDEQEQTDDLSMDQMTTATPRGEQSQDDEYDMSDMTRQDAGEQQDGMEESDHTEDFSMDDMTDASATNDEQNSADEEESIMPPSDSGSSDSGESEDEDNSYHY